MRWAVYIVPNGGIAPSPEAMAGTRASVHNAVAGLDAEVLNVIPDNLSAEIESRPSTFVLIVPDGDKIGSRFLREAEDLLVYGADVAYPSIHEFGDRYGWVPVRERFGEAEIQMGLSLPLASPFRRDLVLEIGGLPDNPFDWWREFHRVGANFARLPGLHYFRRT